MSNTCEIEKRTGTQLIYLGYQKNITKNPTQIIFDTTKTCRLCGGHMLGNPEHESFHSDNWTDENQSRRRDQDYLCEACAWFSKNKEGTRAGNRSQYWCQSSSIYATENQYIAFDSPAGVYHLLKTDFETPCTLSVRGNDTNLAKKHQQWRNIDATTYDRKNTKISLVGIQAFKDTDKHFGVAMFNADIFCKSVDILVDQGESLILPTLKYMTSSWQMRNQLFTSLRAATAEISTPTIILACYIASYLIIPAETQKKTKKPNI